MHAERCPVCGGKGVTMRLDGWNCHEDACHGCGGKGWVEVSDGTGYTTLWVGAPAPNDSLPYETGDFPGLEPRYTSNVPSTRVGTVNA